MKQLREMTREELWALSNGDTYTLWAKHYNTGLSFGYPCCCNRCTEKRLERLDTLRQELQQDKAAK